MMIAENCSICRIISQIDTDERNFFISDMKTGYAVLSNRWQYFRGYTLFICKECVSELHELPIAFRKQYLYEMSLISQAVFNAFRPQKLNYELLGNGCKHLHWHIIPRYGTDPKPNKPIWEIERAIFDATILKNDEAETLKDAIKKELLLLYRT